MRVTLNSKKGLFKKVFSKDTFPKSVNYISRFIALVLFGFVFFSGLNPGKISKNMGKNASLIKTAFFFKDSVTNIMSNQNSSVDFSGLSAFENSSESEDEVSYDDFYASFAAMLEDDSEFGGFGDDFDDEGTDLDDSEDFESGKAGGSANKIAIEKFSVKWNSFAENHPEIAEALKLNHTASLLTFISVLICVCGFYLISGKKIIKKIGYILLCAGGLCVCATMPLYNSAFAKLTATMDTLEVLACEPSGIVLYVVFGILAVVFSVLGLIFDGSAKTEKSDESGELSNLSLLSPQPFLVTYRIISLLLFILLFIPGANPARISENISRNVSLFTSGFSYGTYIQNMQRVLIRGWLPEYVVRFAWISSLLVCVGVIACGVAACMSVGNNKLKRYGNIVLLGGSFISILSLFGIYHAYNLVCSSSFVDKIEPLEPASISFYLLLLIVIAVCGVISLIKCPAPEKDEKCQIDQSLQLFLMLMPFLLLVFIFSYLPLWGWRYAFFDYNAGDTLSMDAWVGLKWFKAPFENAATRSDILRVLRNTMAMSGLGILFSWLPMFFAIFLSEIKNTTTRRIVQTLTTIPNFISWVLVYAIAFCIFGTEGFISSLMVQGGIWDRGVNMLMGDKAIWLKMWLWGTWKGLGWSAIMYIAAISSIDQQLYEAATVDGAGRLQKMIHITLPELIPTYFVLLILSVSNILSNGMDQYLVFKNPTNKGPIEVLDLYVYQLSFGSTTNSQIPFSTVVSMFKSLVSVVLLFATNKISKLVRGSSIF